MIPTKTAPRHSFSGQDYSKSYQQRWAGAQGTERFGPGAHPTAFLSGAAVARGEPMHRSTTMGGFTDWVQSAYDKAAGALAAGTNQAVEYGSDMASDVTTVVSDSYNSVAEIGADIIAVPKQIIDVGAESIEDGQAWVVDKKEQVTGAGYSTANYVTDSTVGAVNRAKLDAERKTKKLMIGLAATAIIGVMIARSPAARRSMRGQARPNSSWASFNLKPRKNPGVVDKNRVATARVVGAATGAYIMSPLSPEDVVLPVIGTIGGLVLGGIIVAASLLAPEKDLVRLTRKLTG